MRERDGLKVCPKCGRTLAVSQYHKCMGAADGLQVYCKECLLESLKANRRRNRERNLKRLAGEDV